MKADDYLRQNGFGFEVIENEEKVETCQEAAEVRNLEPSQVVKSLVVNLNGENLHYLLPGDRELSAGKIGEYRLVNPERSRELTGQESGTVHPFSTDLKHLVDHRLFEQDILSFTTGEFTRAVKITPDKFREALQESGFQVEIGDFVEPIEREIDELAEAGLGREESSFVLSRGYRSVFHSLKEEYDPVDIVTALRKLLREEVEPEKETVSQIIERSENETHMQKLSAELASEGELPEEEAYDIEEVVSRVIDENPDAVRDYRNGKESAINYLMGEVMGRTSGRAGPDKTTGVLREMLRDNESG